MSNRTVLNDEKIEQMMQLRELGHTYSYIAQQLGCSTETVSWQCCRLGVEAPNSTGRSWDNIKGPAETKRGDHIVRRFTPEEDKIIQARRVAGSSIVEIAREIKRRPNSITGRLYALARREARRELEEEKLAPCNTARLAPCPRPAP